MSQYNFGTPGLTAIRESQESEIFWGPLGLRHVTNGVIAGAARDTGNTPTAVLRPGLVLGQITASGKYTAYSATATDGSQVAKAVLPLNIRMTDEDGNDADRVLGVAIGGPLKSANLIGLDAQARKQLAGHFLFDDDPAGKPAFLGGAIQEVAKATNYTVVAADNGTLFTTTGAAGAMIFTLPALAAGLRYEFLNTVDQNMTVASAAGDDMVVINDAAADSVAFSTLNEKIGGRVQVESNAAGTLWYVSNKSAGTNTITPTT